MLFGVILHIVFSEFYFENFLKILSNKLFITCNYSLSPVNTCSYTLLRWKYKLRVITLKLRIQKCQDKIPHNFLKSPLLHIDTRNYS